MAECRPTSGELPVLGLDGGGSKTLLALAARDGTVLRCWGGAGINPFDEPAWRPRLRSLAHEAGPVAAVGAGLPGYGEVPGVSAAQDAAVADIPAGCRTVHNDVQVAFDGAFGDAPGVLVLAGTGSMAWAQDAAGRSVRVGGWGHGFGDEGSAFAVGQRAVAVTSHVLDGRSDAQDFARAMLGAAGLAGRPDPAAALVGWYHGSPHVRSSVAGLARHVDARAASGCEVALEILRGAAAELARLVEAARRRLPGAGAAWAHAGGLFNSRGVTDALRARLGAPLRPALPPLGGALWRAARLAGWDTGPGWTARVAATLSARLPAPSPSARTIP